MDGQAKQFSFKGTAGGFFVASIVSAVMMYVLVIGWPIAFNFMSAWIVDNLEVNGRKLKYKAGYGEVLGLLLVGFLLTVVTLGIYTFWFTPKIYRFIAEHTEYADGGAPVAAAPVAPVAPITAPIPADSVGPITQ